MHSTDHNFFAYSHITIPQSSLAVQVLFQDGRFQWERLENLICLARDGSSAASLDLSSTARDAVRVLLLDTALRQQLIAALTQDNRLHIAEVQSLLRLVQDEVDVPALAGSLVADLPSLSRSVVLSWSDRVLSS
jgi:hypothetical protein